MKLQDNLQPPEGGWGWMVVFGSALSHMFLIPILQNFTLIFNDGFKELGFTSTEITTLLSLNVSFGFILGLINGPLLKAFGYRKVALVGITLHVTGILCTGIAKSYAAFVIFYGLLSSLGMAMVMASFSLAINTYFVKKRSKAIGYFMTLAGLGPVLMPYAISYLLSSYGVKWTIFLLSGLSLHSFIGALLLQPVKWHMKIKDRDLRPQEKKEDQMLKDGHSLLEMSVWGSRMSLSNRSSKSRKVHSSELLLANNTEVIQDRSKPRKLSVTFLDNDDYKNMMNSTLHMIERVDIWEGKMKFASVETLSPENDELLNDPEKDLMDRTNSKFEGCECEADKAKEVPTTPENVTSGLFIRSIRYLEDLYDLDLLRDPFYVIIMTGLSVAFVGEAMFSSMTPIIMREKGFGIEETATFMSVIAGSDLFCRSIASFIKKKLNFSAKQMYLIALLMLVISRGSMYLVTTYDACLVISFGIGIGKGFRSVFWGVVLPDYVPLHKLPSAAAFQSLINGILSLVTGPLLGVIVALTKSYLSVIAGANILTLTTILLWSGEMIYLKCKKKKLTLPE